MNRQLNFKNLWRRFGTIAILVLLVALIGALSPQFFLTGENLTQIALQSSINILISLGEFFAILIAGIDLSVGSVVALTGLLTAKMLVGGVPMVVAILVGGVVVGAILGLINGSLTNSTGLHPFIITIGTMAIFRGVTLIISDARPVYGLPDQFMSSVGGWVFGIPIPILIAVLVAIFLSFLTQKTKAGRNLYAIGGNKSAAFYNGIAVKSHVLLAFVISGIAAGIAGVVMLGRLGAAEPLAGVGFETNAIAAAIIGGTSFFGGVGKVSGVVVGALIIGVISNGLNILNVPTFYQQIVMGSLIIVSVSLDHLISRKR
jgi:D-allose transport system permease protein